MKASIFFAAVLLVTTTSCDEDKSAAAPQTRAIEGDDFQYVLDTLVLPTNEEEAHALAFDLNGNGMTDNQLGLTLAVLKTLKVDLQPVAESAIARGELALLLNVRATSLATSAVAGLWALFGALPMPPPCGDVNEESTCGRHLQGDGSFQIAANSPRNALLTGSVSESAFLGGPGTVDIQLPIGDGEPVSFELVAARVSADMSLGNLTGGILGGAITEDELHATLFPAIHHFVVELTEEDCTGTEAPCCDPGSTGKTLMSLIDENKDCAISLEEFRANPQIQQLFPLDVDLFNEAGELAPGEDGIRDSLSFGIGFSAARASFPAPL